MVPCFFPTIDRNRVQYTKWLNQQFNRNKWAFLGPKSVVIYFISSWITDWIPEWILCMHIFWLHWSKLNVPVCDGNQRWICISCLFRFQLRAYIKDTGPFVGYSFKDSEFTESFFVGEWYLNEWNEWMNEWVFGSINQSVSWLISTRDGISRNTFIFLSDNISIRSSKTLRNIDHDWKNKETINIRKQFFFRCFLLFLFHSVTKLLEIILSLRS